MIEHGQSNRSPVFERDEPDRKPLQRGGSKTSCRRARLHREDHRERHVDAHHCTTRHARVRDERDESQQNLRQLQPGIEAANHEKWSKRPDEKRDCDDAPEAHLTFSRGDRRRRSEIPFCVVGVLCG